MKTKTLICTILCILWLLPNAQAQFFKTLKKNVTERLEQKVSDRLEEEVDKKAQKTMDTLFQETKKKKRKEKQDSDNDTMDLGGMMGDILNPKDVETEMQYSFPVTAMMEVTDYSKRKAKTMLLEQSYGSNALLNIVADTPGPIIMDFKNEAAIILDVKPGVAQIMSLSWMKKMMNKKTTVAHSEYAATVIKTGATKVVNGYTCYEYKITHDDIEMNAWFAPEVNFNYQDYLQGFSKMFSGNRTNTLNLLNNDYGYVMEMTALQEGKEISKMKVISLSEKEKTVQLSKYRIEKMF